MVHEKLHAYIKQMGIKQGAIARYIGITEGLLSQMLTGKTRLTAEVFFAVCAFLHADPNLFAPDKQQE